MSDLRDRTISRQAAEIRALREQLEERDERIRQIIQDMRPPTRTPEAWALTASEERLFVALATRGYVEREIGNIIVRRNLDAMDPNLISVRISSLKRKLRDAGVAADIETVWGRGYRLVNPSHWKEVLT